MSSKEQLMKIKELQKQCEEFDSIQIKLNWVMLENRENDEINNFIHYESGRLVGFLALYNFGNKFELCGMVSPAWRRKGIFTQLFNSALRQLQGSNCSLLLVNAPAESISAKGFLQQMDLFIQL